MAPLSRRPAAWPRPAPAARAGPTAPGCRRPPAPARRRPSTHRPAARRTDTTLHAHRMQRQVGQRAAQAGRGRRQRHAVQARLLQFFDGVVVGAVEVAAQQAVARVARVAGQADHPAHRHAHQRQRVAGQHQRAFDGLGHHLGGAGGAQRLEVGVVDGAHDHRHLRRVLAHQAQDLQRRGRVRVADHHRAGARQAGGHQALQPRGIAEHHALAGGGGLAHAVGVEVQRHVGDALACRACAPGSGRCGRSRR